MVVDDAQGTLLEATPRQEKRPSISVSGTGTAYLLRPYRGYGAALDVSGDSFAVITAHRALRAKLAVSVGAVPSAEDIAQAVWNGLASKFNAPNTMGNKVNAAGSGGVDLDALAEAVWDAPSSLTVGKFLGLK
jgi:hypothetical protein